MFLQHQGQKSCKTPLGKVHGMFIRHCNLLFFLGPRQDSLPQFFELELCGKDCDKGNVCFKVQRGNFCNLTPSRVRMSSGKNRAESVDFWSGEHEVKTCGKVLHNRVFFQFCRVKTLQIPVFLAGLL